MVQKCSHLATAADAFAVFAGGFAAIHSIFAAAVVDDVEIGIDLLRDFDDEGTWKLENGYLRMHYLQTAAGLINCSVFDDDVCSDGLKNQKYVIDKK